MPFRHQTDHFAYQLMLPWLNHKLRTSYKTSLKMILIDIRIYLSSHLLILQQSPGFEVALSATFKAPLYSLQYICGPLKGGVQQAVMYCRKQVRTTQSILSTWQAYKEEAERRRKGEFRV